MLSQEGKLNYIKLSFKTRKGRRGRIKKQRKIQAYKTSTQMIDINSIYQKSL